MKRLVLSCIALVMALGIITSPAVFAASPYVAMGDSVAAGLGLPGGDAQCGRSSQAYPYKVAAELGVSVVNLACSGAKVDEGIYGKQDTSGTDIAPQLDQAFADGTPKLITMTIGANDARWVQYLRKCQLTTCGTTFDNATAKVLRGDLRIELYWALTKIERMSDGTPPRVFLNGYYAPFARTVCPGTEQITTKERSWLRARTADLNQAIRSVTNKFDFAEYVPISFSGHELCNDDPWVQGLGDPAPLHPTVAGQDAIATANLKAIQSSDVFGIAE